MKLPLLLMVFLICCFKQTKANKIDSLTSKNDVIKFISPLLKQKYIFHHSIFQLERPDSVDQYFPCDSTIEWQSEMWQKIDFNKDGLTDLFVIIYVKDTLYSKFPGYKVYVVIDKKDQFQVNEIPDYNLYNCYAVKPIIINNHPCLLYRHYKSGYTIDTLPGMDSTTGLPNMQFHDFQTGKTDTLIYKFGGFIEWNEAHKDTSTINSIYFETTPCFGVCPVFNLNIFKDRTAYYLRHFNLEETSGNFRGIINKVQFEEIISLINYLNIKNEKRSYSINATDNQTGKLMVFFSDGSVKEISDYGLQGTLGLVRLYDLLFELRLNQQWK